MGHVLSIYKNIDLLIGPAIHKKIIKPWREDLRDAWLKTNLNYINVELGYLGNRRKNPSIGYNGINGEAIFLNSNSPGDRWDKFKKNITDDYRIYNRLLPEINKPYHLGSDEVKLPPWRNTGDEVLIIQQIPTDCALISRQLPAINMDDWTLKQKQKYEKMGHKVRIRPTTNPGRSLEQDFIHAKLVVTCSSNCGVLSVLAGIPTIAEYPISMVYNLCKKNKTPDREQWLKNLLYCQWHLEEIENGDMWDHLKTPDLSNILSESQINEYRL